MHCRSYYTGISDIVLLKYSSAGLLLWTRQTGTSSSEIGRGVSASADGQYIYVAGDTQGSLNGQTSAGDCIPPVLFL